MKRIVTGEQAKAIDRYSIEKLGMPGIVLMERAALKLVHRIQKRITKEQKLLVVCGSGNNGGDGMAAARILHSRGYQCEVYFAGKREKMTESAKIQWNLLERLSVPLIVPSSAEENKTLTDTLFSPEKDMVLIDALFGVGLSRKVTGEYAELIQKMNRFRCFAVDLPSGMNSDTGCAMTECADGSMTAVKAEMTVTFGYVKTGLLLGTGRMYAGEVFTEDIGFPALAEIVCEDDCMYLEEKDKADLLPERRPEDNKGSCGKTLIFAGSETMIGAAFFAGLAAYRSGAGLVEIVTCRQNIPVLAGMLPSAVYIPAEELFLDIGNRKINSGKLEKKIEEASCVVLGPGLGRKKSAVRLTEAVLRICSRREKILVLDADGLNILSEQEEWYGLLTDRMILTPHLKEMSRLCGKTVEEIKTDMVGTAKDFAKSHQNVTLLLKDSRSVITNGKSCYLNMTGNDGMAVGGSGDVLSGVLGGLMAQAKKKGMCKNGEGIPVMAALGAYLHGQAGDAAEKKKNAYSMMAEDILEGLGEAFRQNGAGKK